MSARQSEDFSNSDAAVVVCQLPASAAKTLAKIDLECNLPPWIEGQFKTEFTKDCALILGARLGGQIVGFIAIESVADEAHIMNFGVLPSSRRQGAGRVLLYSALAQLSAARIRTVTLEVRAGNTAARCLYIKAGFEEVSIRPGYYSENREDGIIARLDIDDFMEKNKSELSRLGITN